MTILRIHDHLTDAQPLRRVARDVREDEFTTDAFQQFVYDLKDTMCAYRGLGLAATQVDASAPDGTVWRVFVMGQDGLAKMATFCNPKILEAFRPEWLNEGCLSFRSVPARLRLPTWLKLEAMSDDGVKHVGTVEGLGARVCAHETEHLDGRTMIDRMTHVEKARFLQRVRKAPGLLAVGPRGETIEGAVGT